MCSIFIDNFFTHFFSFLLDTIKRGKQMIRIMNAGLTNLSGQPNIQKEEKINFNFAFNIFYLFVLHLF